MIEKVLKACKETLDQEKTVVLSIKVSTRMPRTRFTAWMENGTLKMDVSSAPEKGKANKEIIKYLSKQFSVPKGNVEILSGETSALKLIRIKRTDD